MLVDNYYYTFTYFVLLYIKVTRQLRCFMENLLRRKTTWWTTQTYNVKGDNQQVMTSGSVLKFLLFFPQSGSVIVFSIP